MNPGGICSAMWFKDRPVHVLLFCGGGTGGTFVLPLYACFKPLPVHKAFDRHSKHLP